MLIKLYCSNKEITFELSDKTTKQKLLNEICNASTTYLLSQTDADKLVTTLIINSATFSRYIDSHTSMMICGNNYTLIICCNMYLLHVHTDYNNNAVEENSEIFN